MIAEYSMIHFNEFVPTLLNKDQMHYYQLTVKQNGFTQYNPKVNPSVLQSVGVAALRYGHSQVTSNYQVQKANFYETYHFSLKNKYFEMSDIWDGNVRVILLLNLNHLKYVERVKVF